ncbi:MAG: protein translocase subunit SecD [Methylococcales bacterium]|nr:protein translocase subunit SecD [Methylococcales bacterium]
MNQYPAWKYGLIIFVVLFGLLFAMPNLYVSDPAIQVTSSKAEFKVDEAFQKKVTELLQSIQVDVKGSELADGQLLVRFKDTESQLKASDKVRATFTDYTVALNLAPTTPDWLKGAGGQPMYLGLDLRGGLHFLMEVDMTAAIAKSYLELDKEMARLIKKNRIRGMRHTIRADHIEFTFKTDQDRDAAYDLIHKDYEQVILYESDAGDRFALNVKQKEAAIREVKAFALEQNITTLRNRVNELGVAEPIIQRQGDERVVVQLPGIQDSAYAKEVLGATATLEFRMVYEGLQSAESRRVPAGAKRFKRRGQGEILLKTRVITTGDHITFAKAGVDENGQPSVSIRLDSIGAREMDRTTAANLKKPMAVIFIEKKVKIKRDKDGKPIINEDGEYQKRFIETKEVINVATIQGQFSSRFQVTGLDSSKEASRFALLLRAGSLKAPMYFIEERTIGPSLGQANIDKGRTSVVVGFVLVLIFMAVYYRAFGLVANFALTLNLVLIVAVLSLLQATLTMPGIAGIVLTVGMAVDANVLVFERIKEEIRNGSSPQLSIHAGYEKALSTIADANITTLLAAIVLFSFGTGAIKGFAVTLAIGILTSMFTAIMGTRAIINFMYGGKSVKKLNI